MKRSAAAIWFAGLVVSFALPVAVQAQGITHAFNGAAAHDAGAIAHLAAGSHLGSDMRAAEHIHPSSEASHVGNVHSSSAEYRGVESHVAAPVEHVANIHPSSSEYHGLENRVTASHEAPKVQPKPEPRVTASADTKTPEPKVASADVKPESRAAISSEAPKAQVKPESRDAGLANRGFKAKPGTRLQHQDIPENWRIRNTDSAGGTKFTDPKNPQNEIRVMQGNPKSKFPNSREPYVRWQAKAKPLDRDGKILLTEKTPEAHIPLEQWKYKSDPYK